MKNSQHRLKPLRDSLVSRALTLVLSLGLGSCGEQATRSARDVAWPERSARDVAWPERSARDVAWPELGQAAAEKQDGQQTGDGQKDAAVIVGLEKYQNLPGIPGAEANSLDWYHYLTRTRAVPRGHVTHLMNADAKSFRVKEALKEASKQVGPGGRLWFIFIGHGAPSQASAGQAEEPLIVGYDAELTVAGLEERSLRQREVLGWMTDSGATPVALFDACFSGSSRQGTSLVPGLQVSVVVESATAPSACEGVVLTAARSNEFAGPLPGAQRPAFSYLALAALRGWGDYDKNGEVTGQEVADYANETLRRFLRGERSQTPTITGRTSLGLAKASEPEPNMAVLVSQYRGENRTPEEMPRKRQPKISSESSSAPNLETKQSPSQNVVPRPAPAKEVPPGDMIRIPAGTFMMGSDDGNDDEKPVHRVSVARFEMDRTEVTAAAYQGCVTAGSCRPASAGDHCNAGKADKANHPINCVDWDQAKSFCSWAGKRLPTEEEWEYAARGADGEKYPWGTSEPSNELRWNRWETKEGTCAVGNFPSGASPFGIQDMAGNVWEWTSSGYSENYQNARSIDWIVSRGGSWSSSHPSNVRAALRMGFDPSNGINNLGFRCAR